MFEPLPSKFDFVAAEKRVLEFWDRHDVFHESMRRRSGAPRFVFYEGPPTANGLPHPGHCLTRVIKDIFPRYRTMTGHLVERKAGWDTHGLPVEREVEKELMAAGQMKAGGKAGIEEYGVERFVLRCIESVFRYTREWEELTRRLGYWVDLKDAYVTYHQSYVESVWWSLKTLFERGLLYQAHKVVWWWAQGGTALSAGEVGEGYRTVDDPSVFVKFPLVTDEAAGPGPTRGVRIVDARNDPELADQLDSLIADIASAAREAVEDVVIDMSQVGFITSASLGRLLDARTSLSAKGRTLSIRGASARIRALFATVALDRVLVFTEASTPAPASDRTSLLIWTTTPWTLISNHFAAVHPQIDYALVFDAQENEHLYVAAPLVESIARKLKRNLAVVSTCKGSELIGRRYLPPFSDAYYNRPRESMQLGALPGETGAHATLGRASQLLRDSIARDFIGWRVLAADFVTLDAGTGIVHEAPAFGEVDFNLWREESARFAAPLPMLCAVRADGTFNDDAPPPYRGRWVKDCDKEIIRELRDVRKTPWGTPLLVHQETYRHEYPFCPRAPEDPLIQYARRSWFVRTSQFKDEFVRNNAAINWLPEHIREGRFGDFLRNNVDWALSRERYWGTPLPIWVCDKCGAMEALGSFAELKARPGASDALAAGPDVRPADVGRSFWDVHQEAHRGALPDHLRVHKPYIDAWTYACGSCKGTAGGAPGRMRRVPEVIDCWWDAGSMPFAQWGFPHEHTSIERFRDRFPADFISEAIDQTRGWFYGLLSISTLLFGATRRDLESCHDPNLVESLAARRRPDSPAWLIAAELQTRPSATARRAEVAAGVSPHPYQTCICLGHILGEDGTKMSKRLKNYKEPTYIFDTYGADAMRWFFLAAQPPWTTVRFQEAALRDAHRDFLVKLYNVLSFFTIYASIDGFEAIPDAAHGKRPTAERSELDRWIISELHRTIRFVREHMDRFENFPSAQRLSDFVDALSNWYVRRSRERFWRPVTQGADRRTPNAAGRVGTAHQSSDTGNAGGMVGGAHPTAFSAADQDKWDAYHTLYGCLYTLSLLIAPFTPFFAESMYQTLVGGGGTCRADQPAQPRSPAHPLSVHLCDYPVVDESLIDEELAAEMDLVREICSLGLAARAAARVRVRQPLARVEIILAIREHEAWLQDHATLIAEELNIKAVEFTTEADHYVSYKVLPNFKAIGAKYRALVPGIKAALSAMADPAAARKQLATNGALPLMIDGQPVSLTAEEVEIRLEAKPGWSAAQGRAGVVVLSTEIPPELRDEGLMRELIHHVQAARKDENLSYVARITIRLACEPAFAAVVRRFDELIRSECLATAIEFTEPGHLAAEPLEIDSHRVAVAIEPTPTGAAHAPSAG